MKRREAIKKTAILMGGLLSTPTLSVLKGYDADTRSSGKIGSGKKFTKKEEKTVSRIADLIIPPTDTPGAEEAKVPEFIMMMIRDAYPDESQKKFHKGLANFNSWCQKRYNESFLEMSESKQETAVAELDKRVLGGHDNNEDLSFYRMFKELTLLGFFTSKPGVTETQRYAQIPGRYEGCEVYEDGDQAWAPLFGRRRPNTVKDFPEENRIVKTSES